MLPKPERLTQRNEFNSVYQMRKSVANSMIILYVGNKKSDETQPTKAAFVVSKKIHKKAVCRNRAKRLMREAYKNIRVPEDFCLKDFERLIFIARPEILEGDYKKVNSALVDCMRKVFKKYRE
jgi:ribonuclease P protein component